MGKTDNTLSEELQKRVEQSADSFVGRLSTQFQKTHQRIGYIAGATEYAPYKEKFEHAIKLLQTVKGFHEAGLLPGIFIYNEIKSFLDGSK